jgi:hypothetical protein
MDPMSIFKTSMGTAFTKRYLDRSSPIAYRFQFYCDRSSNLSIDLKEPTIIKTSGDCAYAFLSTFQPNAAGTVAKVVKAANILINSAKKENLAAASEALNLAQRDKYWEEAFDKAVEEAKPNFHQCPQCKRWVCVQNCWREEENQCLGCLTGSPASEITLSKAQQFFTKVWENVQSAVDIKIEKQSDICPHCGSRHGGGKYCGMCGESVEKETLIYCGQCGEALSSSSTIKFCPNCGDPLDFSQPQSNS